jgi:hypothetical protein
MIVENVVMVFPYGELNSIAFQNAQIFRMKKMSPQYKFVVYTPTEFRDMYFHADRVKIITPSPYLNYDDVTNYKWDNFMNSQFTIRRHSVFKWVAVRLIGRIHLIKAKKAKFLNSLTPEIYHKLPYCITASGRQRKFLVRTGIFRKIKKIEKKSVFLGVGYYFDFFNQKLLKGHDEGSNFQSSFLCLEYMIKNDALLTQEQISYRANQIMQELTLFQKNQYKIMLDFIESNSITIFLRTRNKKIATIHNAPVDELSILVKLLIDRGIAVINSGVPCMHLNISSSKLFLEISHELPPIVAMELGSRCKAVMTSAGGDFFVGYAATNIPLILFDKEWSMISLTDPISIISARKHCGLVDLDLTDNLNSENFEEYLGQIARFVM